MNRDWQHLEAALGENAHLYARLARKGLCRPLTLALLALLFLALCYGVLGRSKNEAIATLSISEGRFNQERGVLGRGDLRGWVEGRILTRVATEKLQEDLGLFAEQSVDAALMSLREDVVVRVADNYYLVDRGAHKHLRSARIEIRYTGSTHEQATVVARALAEVFVVFEQEREAYDTEMTIRAVAKVAERARSSLLEKQPTRLSLATSIGTSRANWRLLTASDEVVARLRRRASRIDRRLYVAHVSPAKKPLSRSRRWLYAGIVTVGIIPLLTIFLGAFDSTVRSQGDFDFEVDLYDVS